MYYINTIGISKYFIMTSCLILWAGCGSDVDKELVGVDEPKKDEQCSPREGH